MRSERVCSLARYVMSLPPNAAMTEATQWFERTLDDSANRRISLPEAFLATDVVLAVLIDIASGFQVWPKVIERHVKAELPFMATENLLMEAVKRGGDRQQLHEVIREHSMEAAKVVKAEGKDNDLLERLKNDPAFASVKDDFDTIVNPAKFVGRAPEQVADFLAEVVNPSEMLLAGRPQNTSGNCAVCTMEGTRPLIAEIQALVSATAFPAPRRTSNGIDYNRLCLILAVLEKRLGMRFSANDVYINVIGGLRLDEPASDLAVAMALISSLADRAVPDDLIAIGELGLSGECRAVSGLEYRVKEAARLGFKRAVVPYRNLEKRQIKADIQLISIKSIFEILRLLSPQEKQTPQA